MAELRELNVRISGSETIGRSHTVYTVMCSAGVNRWEVRKRFSDFVQLNAAFKAKQKITGILPPKQLFGKMSDATIKKREEGLGAYLETLLLDMLPPQVDMVRAFCQVPQSLLRQQEVSSSSSTAPAVLGGGSG
eukprot:CAMPEP_0173104218 /NCGR_PEP_ID=MMETSP1102-20130122/39056_1 /TAXON_ID=49646 /ORGANISM="Geminigera sp., Strain Caron Lab Isolate" /LENGTH=133 /DNA_ID=CAMNT_0013999585 /DNA_START=10 /DNA_END=407 /DNA_ORIENTATION=+